MQLTHKAIARMAGYRIRGHPTKSSPYFYWQSRDFDLIVNSTRFYAEEEEAWKACCIENNLIEGE